MRKAANNTGEAYLGKKCLGLSRFGFVFYKEDVGISTTCSAL